MTSLDDRAAGQRPMNTSGQRKRIQDFGASSVHLEDRSGEGWLWSPRTGDMPQTRRAVSAESFRRRSPSWDLFAEGGANVSLTPRGQRKANLASIARGEAPAPAWPSTPRSPRALSSRKGNEPKARPKSEASTRSASETRAREAVSELSSVHRARACSVKGHHYKNKSLTSSGLWRDLPLYTPWGLLESTQQPSVSCANLTASRQSAKAPGEVVAPYAHIPDPETPVTPRTPRPNSARDHYQKAMSMRSPLVDEGEERKAATGFEGRSNNRPRGTSSPSQLPVGGSPGSARARHGYPPSEVKDAKGKEVITPRSPSAADIPAGMHTRLGRIAIAEPLDATIEVGGRTALSIIPAATRRSDDVLHGIEESRVTPRRFSLPSQRAVSRQKISNNIPGSNCQTPRPKVKPTNGNADLKLELAGLRRARAASSGFSARRKPQRWQV